MASRSQAFAYPAHANGASAQATPCRVRFTGIEGPGIEAEDKARIFDAFQRGEIRGHEGVGLGLATASHAAKPLNAELTVEQKVGKGSTFQLAL